MVECLATEHNEIYRALPGLEVPVGEALLSLSNMWDAPASSEGSRAPSEFRASRMNFILHFGFEASTEESEELFQSVISFSQRYPCRIIALCPSRDKNATGQGIVCKIFSECYIGEGQGDMSCCEAIVFGYTLKEKQYLEDQISIFLESDLPTYYWPYRFDSPENLSDYQSFFKNVNRVVVDTASETYQPHMLDIAEPSKVYDLAFARTLSARQSIGQFFSVFSAEDIVNGLNRIEILTSADHEAEMVALSNWIQSVLGDCGNSVDKTKPAESISCGLSVDPQSVPTLRFSYGNGSSAECMLDFKSGVAHLRANIGGDDHAMNAAIHLLNPDDALAESLFFG